MWVDAAAMCGVMITLGIDQRGESGGSGSVSKTSSAAPAIRPASQSGHEVGQIDDRPAADVDQVGRRLHRLEFIAAEELDGFRRVRGGDHHKVALAQQIEQPIRRPNFGQNAGNAAATRVDAEDFHAEGGGPPADFRPDVADADHAQRTVGKVQVPAIDLADEGRAVKEIGAADFAADRLPSMPLLPVAIEMQVPREGEHEAHHVIGDDVGEQAPHVAQHAGVRDQLIEQVMLEARRRRLHPAEPTGAREQRRRDLAEERVGVDDLSERVGVVLCVDDRHCAGGVHDLRESFVVDWWKYQELHDEFGIGLM